jgi:alpha-tubulin suppressor-like RCC1 family protein
MAHVFKRRYAVALATIVIGLTSQVRAQPAGGRIFVDLPQVTESFTYQISRPNGFSRSGSATLDAFGFWVVDDLPAANDYTLAVNEPPNCQGQKSFTVAAGTSQLVQLLMGSPCTDAGHGHPVVTMSAGRFHTCAVSMDGLRCWGLNAHGEVGDGTTTQRLTPVRVAGLDFVSQVEAGDGSTCALAGGSIWCWGDNQYGQLGDGTTTSRSTPGMVSFFGAAPFQVSIGRSHACAIESNFYSLWCWGGNASGQLGDGTTTPHLTPVRVSGEQVFTVVSAGADYTCAKEASGKVWCWGANASGNLGDGTTTTRLLPTEVTALDASLGTANYVSASTSRTCVSKDNGTTWCWGAADVGNGTANPSLVPVQVTAGGTVFGTRGTLATCIGSTGASCWGTNDQGQLGLGPAVTEALSPTPILANGAPLSLFIHGSVGDVSGEVTSGYGHTCAREWNERWWCWGRNAEGQLGDGTTTNRFLPTPLVLNPPASVPVLDASGTTLLAGLLAIAAFARLLASRHGRKGPASI